ncbi:MAG: pyruvate oxidase [Desulfatitalea sp. BRH_c12]|nr:MAG: pyruvate oxidase [Desulfatitalea sp. BRH_c12]
MAKTTAADIMIDTLIDWGVEVVFGIPGDGINGIMEALRQRQDDIRFIQVRHEEAAAFMACGYAKYSGKLGACLATSGPGGIHLLNGLYDAKLDGTPVIALTGLQYHDLIGTQTQQDVELDKVFQDVSVYNARVMGPAHVRNVMELACRTALAYKGVAHVTMPVDMQEMPLDADTRSKRNVARHTTSEFARGARQPSGEDVHRAAEILNAGRKITLLVGQGALQATDQVLKTAEILQAPVVKALLGKAVVPDDNPYTTGSVGLLGTEASYTAMEECDTLLIVGSGFPYIEYYPKPDKARGIQIDYDPQRIGMRFPVDVGLVGDSGKTLQTLIPLLNRRSESDHLNKCRGQMAKWHALMQKRGSVDTRPMKPQVVAWELGQRLADNAIVSCDSGTITTWWARQIPVKRGQMHSVSGNLASMGCGLPYAIAAQIAYPDRQSVAFVGDGGFSMLMAEFSTAVKYKLPIKVIVIKNNSLGQIKWEQMVINGNPEFGCELENIDYAAVARACGGTGYTIEDPKTCGDILEEALRTPGPVLVDAIVDTHEPPMPPKVTYEQAKELAISLAKGTPYRGRIIKTILGDRLRELI